VRTGAGEVRGRQWGFVYSGSLLEHPALTKKKEKIMKPMYFFSKRFVFYVVIRKAQYEWMRLAVRDLSEMMHNMGWNIYREEVLREKR
jgi:hypothetical protein